MRSQNGHDVPMATVDGSTVERADAVDERTAKGRNRAQSKASAVSASHMRSPGAVLRLWYERTTFHGIIDMCKASGTYSRVVWVIVIFGFYSLAVQNIVEALVEYFIQPTYVTVAMHKQHDYLAFPKLILCNKNRANVKTLESLQLTPVVGAIYGALLFEVFMGDRSMTALQSALLSGGNATAEVLEAYDAWQQHYPAIKGQFADFAALAKRLAHTCEETFPYNNSCVQYRSDGSIIPFDCCHNVNYIEAGINGICMVIAAPEERIVAKGINERVEFNFIDPRLDLYENTNMLFNTPDDGISAVFQSDEMHQIRYSELRDLAPGTTTTFMMKVQQYRVHELPMLDRILRGEGTCDEVFTKELEVIRADAGTKATCITDCAAKLIYDRCGCTPMVERSAPYADITCNYTDMAMCGRLLVSTSALSHIYGSVNRCIEQCDGKCEQRSTVTYETVSTVSVSERKLQQYTETAKRLLEPRDELGYEPDFSKHMRIIGYYSDLTVTTMDKHVKTTLQGLVSSVGGSVSLLTGASLITLVQMCYFGVIGIHKCRQRRRINDETVAHHS